MPRALSLSLGEGVAGTLAEHRGAAAAAGEVVGAGAKELERVGGRRAGRSVRCVVCEGGR